MGRYGLRADQWERIAHLLSGKDGDVGVTAKDNKLFVDAVLYRYRAGVPWRDLPDRFGDPLNIHKRFSRWAKARVARVKPGAYLPYVTCPCCPPGLAPVPAAIGARATDSIPHIHG